MEFKILLIIFFIFFLYVINFLQKKFNFSTDKITKHEKHKLLLSFKKSVPLSGSFYFIPITFFLFYNFNIMACIFCLLFFVLGLLSDLKITNSPKLRLTIQFLLLLIFLYLNDNIIIDTRIEMLNDLMTNNISRILIIAFFFLVLINGFNFIDGVNNLCSLNFLIILFFSSLLLYNMDFITLNNKLFFLICSLSIFIIYNFFAKNFLGDGGVYGLGFLIGYILINLSMLDPRISPYFIANLLWYPSFENLFSIIRRISNKKKNYLPDNEHFHQLLYLYLNKNFFFKRKYLISSLTGILINSYLIIVCFIGYIYYSKTNIQILLIFSSVLLYLTLYNQLKKKIK